MDKLILTPATTTLEEIDLIIADDQLTVTLNRSCKASVERAAAVVEAVVKADNAVYGVNTGFGKLSSVRIAAEDTTTLQRNLILSHCAGVGDVTDECIIRVMMTLKLLSLGRGASGVRWTLIEAIENLLNANITPAVPSAGLEPIELIAKEGLALINGTQFSTAASIVALHTTWNLANTAIVTSAMSTDAIMGSTAPLQPAIHALRGQQGQIEVAATMRSLMDGSAIRDSHRDDDTRVQDPYCIRCQPQVTGACLELLRQAASTLQAEANAVTDNPLVIPDKDAPGGGNIYSGGNFHAEPVAFAADQIAMAIAEIGAISQRRVALMVDPALSFDLPPFLTPDPGLSSGFMVAEIATAALMSENKHLANPCSTDSTPTSANQEDHVSMAAHGSMRLHRMNKNLTNILAVELLCSARGIEFRAPLLTSDSLQAVIAALRKEVSKLEQDRYMARDIEKAANLIQDGLVANVDLTVSMPTIKHSN